MNDEIDKNFKNINKYLLKFEKKKTYSFYHLFNPPKRLYIHDRQDVDVVYNKGETDLFIYVEN